MDAVGGGVKNVIFRKVKLGQVVVYPLSNLQKPVRGLSFQFMVYVYSKRNDQGTKWCIDALLKLKKILRIHKQEDETWKEKKI